MSLSSLGFLSSCALVGNVRPLAEKSETYAVRSPSESDSEWITVTEPESLSPRQKDEDPEDYSNEVSDLVFQSKKTGAIISLNSACRPKHKDLNAELSELTDLLFLSVTDVKKREQKSIEISGIPALETQIFGKMDGKDIRMNTVVLKKGECIYDMLYISRPKFYDNGKLTFGKFVSSFKVN